MRYTLSHTGTITHIYLADVFPEPQFIGKIICAKAGVCYCMTKGNQRVEITFRTLIIKQKPESRTVQFIRKHVCFVSSCLYKHTSQAHT